MAHCAPSVRYYFAFTIIIGKRTSSRPIDQYSCVVVIYLPCRKLKDTYIHFFSKRYHHSTIRASLALFMLKGSASRDKFELEIVPKTNIFIISLLMANCGQFLLFLSHTLDESLLGLGFFYLSSMYVSLTWQRTGAERNR